jgi:allantoinase
VTTELDLLFRAPRMITRAWEVGRCVGIRDGVIVAIEPLDADLRSA